jgi:hypothetical protein
MVSFTSRPLYSREKDCSLIKDRKMSHFIFLRHSITPKFIPPKTDLSDFCVVVFWIVTTCSAGGSMDLRNVGTLPQHNTTSQARRSRLETSLTQTSYLAWKKVVGERKRLAVFYTLHGRERKRAPPILPQV